MKIKENIRIQFTVVLIGVVLLVGKFISYGITHSNAILTDALESIINVVAGAFALYSLILAFKPKDQNHPYGHGKIEFLSAGLEGSLIMIAGVSMIFKSIYNLLHPVTLYSINTGIYIIAATGIVNYIMGRYMEKKGRKSNSITMIAEGKHLTSDAYSTAGLVVGLMIILFTGIVWLDNVVAILFGCIISYTGFGIIRKSVAGIMDETDYTLVSDLINILNSNREDRWIDIHNFRVIKFGATLHIDCHLTLPWYINQREAHKEIEIIDRLINKHINSRVEFFIHVDPCVEESCHICQVKDCVVRQHPFVKKIEWDTENVISNRKHGTGQE